jgi:hypothetical protein
MTPGQYVNWAQRDAQQRSVQFAGTSELLESMISDGSCAVGDLFIDYDVKGHLLSRPGLDALLAEATRDRSVSHVFIPRPDRLIRPNDVMDAIGLETHLRRDIGVWLVFMNRVGPPLRRGQKLHIGELITAAVEYEHAGQERYDLAQKIISAQIALAEMGYSTGGRAPFGFRRCLVRTDGTVVRYLNDGERDRTRGQHVIWVPGPDEEFQIRIRILDQLPMMRATALARLLTEEGVPSPDAGRFRTDNGVRHPTSGVWNASTIVAMARHPINQALTSYGRRLMGDRLRFGANGPRQLEEQDFRHDGKPKVVRNPDEMTIQGPTAFESLITSEAQEKLIAILDQRAGTQRGKARSHDPAMNPLGLRMFDMECAWPLYRQPYNGSFRYACGLYGQSHGKQCHHNTVDGPTAVRFLLSCIRQRLLSPNLMTKLEARIRQIAEAEAEHGQPAHQLGKLQESLSEVERQLVTIRRNMALAETKEQYKEIAVVFEELQSRKRQLQTEAAMAEKCQPKVKDIQGEVAAAMGVAFRLTDLSADKQNFVALGELFTQLNARIFFRFREAKSGKRLLRKPDGGIVTFGAAEAPIDPYVGPTTRKLIKAAANKADTAVATASSNCNGPGSEGISLGNANRGDRIRTCDLVVPNHAL